MLLIRFSGTVVESIYNYDKCHLWQVETFIDLTEWVLDMVPWALCQLSEGNQKPFNPIDIMCAKTTCHQYRYYLHAYLRVGLIKLELNHGVSLTRVQYVIYFIFH